MYGAWSFDGGQIAFTRFSYEGSTILVMSAEGSDIREALPGNGAGVIPEGNFGLQHPAWSPDSRSLIFEEMFLGSGVPGIWMVRLGSREPVQLVPGEANSGTRSTSAVVARSGRVLYNNYNHQTDLYARDLGSGEERRLTAHTRDSGDGRFSPDGKRIAYSSSRSGNFQIWILDLESGNETRLTNNTESDGFPEWSPGGDEIVFTSSLAVGDGESGGHLWISSVGGGGPRLLSEQPALGPVRWSPGGELIGFRSPGAGGATLWVLDRLTGDARKVLDNVFDFDWYRDDQHVIITTYNSLGMAEMRAVDLESGEHVTLLTDPQIELVVSPDGSAVSYCSSTSHYNMNLHILRLSPAESGLPRVVGAPEKITHGDGEWHVHNGGWSPDGKQVVYTRDTDRADMFLLEGVFGEEN